MAIESIATPCGESSSPCGYCCPPGQRSATVSSFRSAGMNATRLSCQVYQRMVDVGWRRSGTWCYKPNLRLSCCPQYTIKLDCIEFKPSKSQRKLVNRWNRFVLAGDQDEATDVTSDRQVRCSKQKGKNAASFNLSSSIHASEMNFAEGESPRHIFEVTIEPSSFTDEKYALFEKYQITVHSDKASRYGFRAFLSDSPLIEERIPYTNAPPPHLPRNYGSYHQLYRLDGTLIAMGVIDILPSCVSSVYFMYDTAWEDFSLGKLSALREASLALEMHQLGAEEMQSLYMGFYIHSCQKMRYKGQYSPSYLADPETYKWFPLSACAPLLEKYAYACFSHPEHSVAVLPGLENAEENTVPAIVEDKDLDEIVIITRTVRGTTFVGPVKKTLFWQNPLFRAQLLACIDSLGVETAKQIAFYPNQ